MSTRTFRNDSKVPILVMSFRGCVLSQRTLYFRVPKWAGTAFETVRPLIRYCNLDNPYYNLVKLKDHTRTIGESAPVGN